MEDTIHYEVLFSGIRANATSQENFRHSIHYEGTIELDFRAISSYNVVQQENSELYDVNTTISISTRMLFQDTLSFSIVSCSEVLSLCAHTSYFKFLINEAKQVARLSGEIEQGLLKISWGENPDLETSYIVSVIGNETELIGHVDCCNLTNTSYSLKAPQRDPCTATNYQVRVAAITCPYSSKGVQPDAYSMINITTPADPDLCTFDTTTALTPTETGEPSGVQANYPSLLLAVAAIIPLLKWQH